VSVEKICKCDDTWWCTPKTSSTQNAKYKDVTKRGDAYFKTLSKHHLRKNPYTKIWKESKHAQSSIASSCHTISLRITHHHINDEVYYVDVTSSMHA
jgi:hypothetical protein